MTEEEFNDMAKKDLEELAKEKNILTLEEFDNELNELLEMIEESLINCDSKDSVEDKQEHRQERHNTDGGKTNFYNTNGAKDVDELAENWFLLGDEFNCLKAIVGIAKERHTGVSRHAGSSAKRDAKKLLHYANRINNRINSK